MGAETAAGGQPIQPPESYPEILGELLTTLQSELHACGLDLTSSNDIAWRTAEKIRDAWGGQLVYVPQGNKFESRQRWEAIWRDFTGQNHAELARRYKVSEQTVYNAINEMRQRQQLKLNLDGDIPRA